MNSPKYNFGEFNKATFLVVVRHCELIFCLLDSPKCDLDEIVKAMIQVVEWHFEVIFCLLINRKYDYFKSKTDDSSRRMALESHVLPLDKPKIRLL